MADLPIRGATVAGLEGDAEPGGLHGFPGPVDPPAGR